MKYTEKMLLVPSDVAFARPDPLGAALQKTQSNLKTLGDSNHSRSKWSVYLYNLRKFFQLADELRKPLRNMMDTKHSPVDEYLSLSAGEPSQL